MRLKRMQGGGKIVCVGPSGDVGSSGRPYHDRIAFSLAALYLSLETAEKGGIQDRPAVGAELGNEGERVAARLGCIDGGAGKARTVGGAGYDRVPGGIYRNTVADIGTPTAKVGRINQRNLWVDDQRRAMVVGSNFESYAGLPRVVRENESSRDFLLGDVTLIETGLQEFELLAGRRDNQVSF